MNSSQTRRTTSLFAILLGLVLAAAYAVIPAAQAQGDRTLGTAGGGRQQVTFIAASADGQPVADLTQAQVELKIDGKARPTQSLHLVKVGGGAPAPEAAGAKKDVPPPYGTNPSEPSRAVLFTVDEESVRTGLEKPIRDAIDQFMGQLAPQDRVGLMTMPHGSINVAISSAKTAVHDQLANVTARLPGTRDANTDACHALEMLSTLTSTLRNLGEGPTTVVVFSAVLVPPGSTAVGQGNAGAAGRGATTTVNQCDYSVSDFQKAGAAAASAHATVYVVQPESGGPANDVAGLRNLAGMAGTPLLNMAFGGEGTMTRIIRESSAYYVAEFDYDAAERDGKAHHVDLKVTAPNVTVRAPSEVTFAKIDPKAAKPLAKDIVKEAKLYTDLPLRVTAYVSRGSGDKVNVLAKVQSADPSAKLGSVSIGLADSTNKMVVVSATPEDIAKGTGSTVALTIPVAQGSYNLHAAAVDASGRTGSADYRVNATLVNVGPMRMGGLTLASASTAGGPVSEKMEFHDEAEIIALFELYGTTSSGMSLAFEIADSPDGPTVKQFQPTGLSPTKDPDRFQVQGTIPIKDLAPGDYIIRAVFSMEGAPKPGSVFRTLRKVK